MIHARLDAATGRLSNIWERLPTYPDDVPLAAKPTGAGPWIYDAEALLAVPHTLTEPERLDGLALPRRVQAALVIRASSIWANLSAQRRARVLAILDEAAAAVVALLT